MIDTLTEIDELAITSILLDRFIAGIENEAQLTVSIHVFYYLIQGDRGLDVPTLSQETSLSRNRVRSTINALVATGKIKPLADNPNRFALIRNGGNNHDQGGKHEICNTGSDNRRVAGLSGLQRRPGH